MISLPPKLSDLRAGTKLCAGLSYSTIMPCMDFETYSPAGFEWSENLDKWVAPKGIRTQNRGLKGVGACVYTEHPDAEVLCFSFNMMDGRGVHTWIPNKFVGINFMPQLFEYLHNGGLIEAWNCEFEYWVWNNICVKKYGWPKLRRESLLDAMAKSRAHGLPGRLAEAGKVLDLSNQKFSSGKKLISIFCVPRNPTPKDDRKRILMTESQEFSEQFLEYNKQDVIAESEASSLIPDLCDQELEFWRHDQIVNQRGVCIDIESVNNCIAVVEQAYEKYNMELATITNGQVKEASKIASILAWLKSIGMHLPCLNDEMLTTQLARFDLPQEVRRVLEIRSMIGSASVKKLYSMKHQTAADGRIHDLFIYHGAHTGRSTAGGLQPQNLPNSGPTIASCENCSRSYYSPQKNDLEGIICVCPWCGDISDTQFIFEWGTKAVKDVLELAQTKSLALMEYYFNDAIAVISGCLRGMVVAAPGYDLISSDFSSIEAVVLAALAGEEWRLEIFRTHGKMYEMSASKITGVPFENFDNYRLETGGILCPDGKIRGGKHLPERNKIGKPAELAFGFGGGAGAWHNFAKDSVLTEDEIKKMIYAWRAASPRIVEMWGGQERRRQPEYYGLEGAAVSAIMSPGKEFEYRRMVYIMQSGTLYSYHRDFPGSNLTYHAARLETQPNRNTHVITFEGWNTNPKMGKIGWIRMRTWGGTLTQNWVQKIARFILMNSLLNLERCGYSIVLHVHDEAVAEVAEGVGAIEEFEKIMSIMPEGAEGWPIKASGGWRAKRYQK